MNVAIIVFSPTGNTRTVATMLQNAFETHEIRTQLLDITRQKAIFQEHAYREFLENHINQHDVLLNGLRVWLAPRFRPLIMR